MTPPLCASARDDEEIIGSPASAKSARTAAMMKCQPPDLHIKCCGMLPVCLSVADPLQRSSSTPDKHPAASLTPDENRHERPLAPPLFMVKQTLQHRLFTR
jgi:hypothetical protein